MLFVIEDPGRWIPETILRACQEIFNEIPTDANLGMLLQQADVLGRREETLAWTCEQLEKSEGNAALRMKAELLRGHWAAAIGLAQKHEPSSLGWSSSESPEGLYVAAVLAGLCGEAIAEAPAAGSLLASLCGCAIPFAAFKKEVSRFR